MAQASNFKTLPELVLNELRYALPKVDFITYENNQPIALFRDHFFEKCAQIAIGLSKLSINEGENIVVVGPSGPSWLMVDLAIQACGGVSVPFFANIPKNVIEDQIDLTKAKKLFWLGDLPLQDFESQISKFESVWVENHSLIQTSKNIALLESLIQPLDKKKLIHEFEQLCQKLTSSQVATIIFTSGSTAKPKGVVLTQNNLVTQIRGASKTFPLNHEKDTALSCLPLAHVFERMVTYFYLSSGVSIHWVDDLQKVAERMQSSKPTVMTSVPRLLEKVFNAMTLKINTAAFPINKIGNRALKLASSKMSNSLTSSIEYKIYDKIFYSKFRKAFGGNMAMMISGGAALPPHLATFFNNIGVPTFQGYGLTESSPVIAANCPVANKIGSVGKAFPQSQIKIDPETEEILSHGPHIMQGYYLQKEATQECIDKDGWLHTGDQGKIDEDGYLFITGRIKELYKTSNGKYVRPVPIEALLCTSQWIDQAMVVADAKPFVTVILSFDDKNLQQLEVLTQQTAKKLEDLLEHDELKKQIQSHIDKTNKSLHPWEQIRKFAWIPKALSAESGELTPTMKIKRHIVQKKYSFIINSMYNT